MNRILVIIVVIMIPLAIITEKSESEIAVSNVTLENTKIEIPTKEQSEDETNETVQVLVSNNKDKSEAFYVDLEEYVIGVVAGEMPASFNMEALKAQAVAARTYALYKQKNIDGYVLSATISDQVYLNEEQMKSKWGSDYDYYYNRVKEAVEATEGQVLTYNGDIIIAYYFAISNGYTEEAQTVFNEDKDYLISVESSWDKNYDSYSSSREISKETFCSKLGIDCSTIEISNVVRADTHYVREITINNKTFTGLEVFNKLSLKSTDFTITVNEESVVIQTFGYGHGVGMSQYGAQAMAKEGYTYDKILTYYYQNTEIASI